MLDMIGRAATSSLSSSQHLPTFPLLPVSLLNLPSPSLATTTPMRPVRICAARVPIMWMIACLVATASDPVPVAAIVSKPAPCASVLVAFLPAVAFLTAVVAHGAGALVDVEGG